MSTFSHPLLRAPLDDKSQLELYVALCFHRADQPLAPHWYDGRQSSGSDARLARGGFLGKGYVGKDDKR